MPPVNELFKLPAQALADVYLVYREPGASIANRAPSFACASNPLFDNKARIRESRLSLSLGR
jgi:hypothetical protein